MAQPGRSWNDPKSPRGRAAGSQPAAPDGAGSSSNSPAGSAPGTAGGGRASWRDKATPAVAQRGKNRHWLVSRTENPNRLRHRVKLGIAAATLLLLVGFYVVYVFFGPRKTPLLLVGILDYAAPLPPNAWTREDFDRFSRTFDTAEGAGSAENIRVDSDLGERSWKNGKDALAALELKFRDRTMGPGGPDRNTVLIYLSGHGILNDDGKPCLVLATDQGNTNTWHPQLSPREAMPTLDLEGLLNTIQQSYPGANKVLLLDCSRFAVNPQIGILENGFAAALKRLSITDENLFLLSAADAGQVGWTLPDLKASAFGYYVCKGLAGRADDAQHGGDEDEIVTLAELARYLRKQVAEQVRARYLVDQTPVLLSAKSSEGRAAQVSLAWSHPDIEDDAGREPVPPVAWSVVDDLWARHKKLKQQGGASISESTQRWRREFKLDGEAPLFYRGADLLSWEAFQQGLLRLEQLNGAGRHYGDEAQRLAAELKMLAEKLQGNAEQRALPATIALRQVDAPAGVQRQVKKFIEAPVAEQDKEEFAKLLEEKYERRAKAAWLTWSQSRRIGAEVDFRRTFDLLARPAGGTTPEHQRCDPIEIRFLRLLDPSGHAPPELFSGEALAIRSAILSRDLAETAAWANDDLRVHYAVEQLVARGDAARRRAEDQLFIQPQALKATGQPWDEAAEHYRQALALAVELSEAIDARDQAWQELPYLAHWLVLRQETDAGRSSVAARVEACRMLFEQSRVLADAIRQLMEKCLSADRNADDATAERFAAELLKTREELKSATSKVRSNLDDLVQYHRDAISDARLAAAPDVLNPRRIRDLLATPLLTGDERRELRETHLTSRRNVQALRTNPDEQGAVARVPLKDNPLLALFGGDAPGWAANPDRLSGKLREVLHARFNGLRSSPVAAETGPAQRKDRMKLTAAEEEARTMAAVWTFIPAYGDPEKRLRDPLATVDAFDRHHAILWHASRSLEDFWGREGDPHRAWYFQALATVALGEARRWNPGETSAAYREVNQTLTEREGAARQWAQVNVPSVQLPPSSDRRRTIDTRPTISVAPKVPQGEAAFIALRSDKQPALMRYDEAQAWRNRLGVPASPLDKPVERITFELPDALVSAGSQRWPLVLFYRGHVYPADLVLTPKDPGQLFELARVPPELPRIIVKGEQGDSGAITIIFDCSGSMEKEFQGVRPMRVAKPVLEKTMEELAEAGTYRVSLWLYGHRLGWGGSKGVVTQCELYGRDPNQLGIPPAWCQPETRMMSEDVAREWPLNPRATRKLTLQNYGEMKQILDSIQGFGVTPLFYSIIKALEEEPNLKVKNAPRRLIVLTDGVNNVNEDQQAPQKRYKSEDVVAAMNQHGIGVMLHVVGFGEATGEERRNPKVMQDAGEWQKDLRKIGKYHEVRELRESSFHELLRQLIGLKRYQVTRSQEPRPIGQERLNRQVLLKDHLGRMEYDVRVVGSKEPHALTLHGGEAIDLYVVGAESANPRLVHERYRRELQTSTMARGTSLGAGRGSEDQAQFFVGFHQPQRKSGFMEFYISIQNAVETLFSQRPAEAWVEITPVGAAAPDKVKPLVFYDTEFATGRPLPVLVCRAIDWPAEARRARIKLFFKMQRTVDTPLRRPVRDVEGEKPHPDLDVRLSDGGKVQFTVSVSPAPEHNGARVTVIEHCARRADLHQAKVELEMPADVVRRQYFHSDDQHEVHHDFIYVGKVQDELMDYRVRITSRQDLERDAFTYDDVVEVEVDR